MNLDELLQNVWTAEAESHFTANAMNIDSKNAFSAPVSSLELQGSLAVVRSFSGKTVDEVWREIKRGQKMRTFDQEMEEGQDQKREPTVAETTLENFLIEVGLYVSDTSLGLDHVLSTPQTFTQRMGYRHPHQLKHYQMHLREVERDILIGMQLRRPLAGG